MISRILSKLIIGSTRGFIRGQTLATAGDLSNYSLTTHNHDDRYYKQNSNQPYTTSYITSSKTVTISDGQNRVYTAAGGGFVEYIYIINLNIPSGRKFTCSMNVGGLDIDAEFSNGRYNEFIQYQFTPMQSSSLCLFIHDNTISSPSGNFHVLTLSTNIGHVTFDGTGLLSSTGQSSVTGTLFCAYR